MFNMSQIQPAAITSFSDEYSWLSNFHPVPIHWMGLDFASVEHAYQASKCEYEEDCLKFTGSISPGQAKRLGRAIEVRADWNKIRLSVMMNLTTQKYKDPTLRDMLLSTGSALIIEGNTWKDTFWGVCNGVGENNLGKIIMSVRQSILQEAHLDK